MDPAGGTECLTVEARHLASGPDAVSAPAVDRGSGRVQVGDLAPVEAREHLSVEVRCHASAGAEDPAGRECGDWAEVQGPVLAAAEGRECLLDQDPDLVRALAADSAMADVDGTRIERTILVPAEAGQGVRARVPELT